MPSPPAAASSSMIDLNGVDGARAVRPTQPKPITGPAKPPPSSSPDLRTSPKPAPGGGSLAPIPPPDKPVPRSLTPARPNPVPAPPAGEKPAPPVQTPPRVVRKAKPTCTDNPAEVKEMFAEVLGARVPKIGYVIDGTLYFQKIEIQMGDLGNEMQIVINNINRDGSRTKIGMSPARFCRTIVDGEKVIKIGIEAAALNLGSAYVNGKVKELFPSGELPLIVSSGATPDKVRIRDQRGGETGGLVDEPFTAH